MIRFIVLNNHLLIHDTFEMIHHGKNISIFIYHIFQFIKQSSNEKKSVLTECSRCFSLRFVSCHSTKEVSCSKLFLCLSLIENLYDPSSMFICFNYNFVKKHNEVNS